MNWDKTTQEKFDSLIGNVPPFMREFARDKVSKKAENLVAKDDRNLITEKDMVDAFFAETPFGFHGPMKSDMEKFGIDYSQYGYDK